MSQKEIIKVDKFIFKKIFIFHYSVLQGIIMKKYLLLTFILGIVIGKLRHTPEAQSQIAVLSEGQAVYQAPHVDPRSPRERFLASVDASEIESLGEPKPKAPEEVLITSSTPAERVIDLEKYKNETPIYVECRAAVNQCLDREFERMVSEKFSEPEALSHFSVLCEVRDVTSCQNEPATLVFRDNQILGLSRKGELEDRGEVNDPSEVGSERLKSASLKDLTASIEAFLLSERNKPSDQNLDRQENDSVSEEKWNQHLKSIDNQEERPQY